MMQHYLVSRCGRNSNICLDLVSVYAVLIAPIITKYFIHGLVFFVSMSGAKKLKVLLSYK